ncbi:MAG: glucosaminidase domain-containing protein [Candidatus Sericytochromatia bacterium]
MPRIASQPVPQPEKGPAPRAAQTDAAGPPLMSPLMTPMAADHTRVTPSGRAEANRSFLEASVDPRGSILNSLLYGSVLREQAQGQAVSELQRRLSGLGYAIADTGVMGPDTCEVLKRFQADHGVQETGEFGATSLQALQEAERTQVESKASIEKLKSMKPAELHKLGRKDAMAFFRALLPAALESERKHGSPAVMTLVQAAVESDFARSPVGGYNIFGIKGEGPAGTVQARTREVIRGKNHYVREPFAKYHNFYEAVSAHGQLFNNGNYDKAMQQYAKDKDVLKFVDNVAKIYATDPAYGRTLKARIKEYGLLELVRQNR